MSKQKESTTLRDKDIAADQRPIPSQAEGDLETVEEDLKQKEKREKEQAPSKKP